MCCAGEAVALPAGTFTIPLDAEGLLTLYWQLDYNAQSVSLEVHSHLPLSAWLALGFSDYGDITHADLCFFWTDWRSKSHLQVLDG